MSSFNVKVSSASDETFSHPKPSLANNAFENFSEYMDTSSSGSNSEDKDDAERFETSPTSKSRSSGGKKWKIVVSSVN